MFRKYGSKKRADFLQANHDKEVKFAERLSYWQNKIQDEMINDASDIM